MTAGGRFLFRGLVTAIVVGCAGLPAIAAASDGPGLASTTPAGFADLAGFAQDDVAAALTAFRASCAAGPSRLPARRTVQPPPPALAKVCARARALPRTLGGSLARRFVLANFTPRLLSGTAFVTGYYEPVVEGSLKRTAEFTVPLLAPPAGMVSGGPGQPNMHPDGAGRLQPVPDRAGIEAGALGGRARVLVWLHEPVDLFFIQVQGSARIRLRDGALKRVAFAGRNNYPYTGIGKVLAQRLHVTPDKMGMSELKQWIRANGEAADQPGGALMNLNKSYVFFRFDERLRSTDGPVGAAGISLTPMRSLAVDTRIWPLGLPFFLDVAQPATEAAPAPVVLHRMAVAQDAGAAILGPTRADLFTGTGPQAAEASGGLRASGRLYVLWPREEQGGGARLQ